MSVMMICVENRTNPEMADGKKKTIKKKKKKLKKLETGPSARSIELGIVPNFIFIPA
jgi:hypothetical protein